MRPLSRAVPKPLLPVADRPLAGHAATAAVKAGADELVFVVGYEGDQIREAFGERYEGVPVEYATQSSQDGTADALRAAQPFVDGQFAVLNGDNLYDAEGIERLFESGPAIGAYRVESPTEYGVLSTTDGTVTDVVEKPDEPPTDLANAGAYVLPEACFGLLDVPMSERGEYELTDVIARLVSTQSIRAVEFDRWLDVGKPWDLLRANERALEDVKRQVRGRVSPDATLDGPVSVQAGAVVDPSARLDGPVLLSPGAHVHDDAVVNGPTLLGPGVNVERGAVVERCVLMDGATVERDTELRLNILGPNVTVGKDGTVTGYRTGGHGGVASLVAIGDTTPPQA